MTKWSGWKAVVRDTILIWILTGIAGFVVGITNAGSDIPMESIGIANIVLGTIGFCVAGCMIEGNRWKHLFTVAVLLWLTSLMNLFSGLFTLANWLVGLLWVFVSMGLGGGFSLLLKKPKELISNDS